MSIERFFKPEGAQELGLIDEIKREHAYLSAAGRSKFLVTTTGIHLAREAASGLREIATYSSANQIYGELHPDSTAYNRLNLAMQDKFLRNFAVYHLAAPLRGIEIALVDRKLTFTDLMSAVPDAAGTKLRDIPPPQIPLDVVIDDEKYREMIQRRREDQSHMIFFGEGYNALPEAIKYYLEVSGANMWIENLVTSGFKRLYSQIEPPLRQKEQPLTDDEFWKKLFPGVNIPKDETA